MLKSSNHHRSGQFCFQLHIFFSFLLLSLSFKQNKKTTNNQKSAITIFSQDFLVGLFQNLSTFCVTKSSCPRQAASAMWKPWWTSCGIIKKHLAYEQSSNQGKTTEQSSVYAYSLFDKEVLWTFVVVFNVPKYYYSLVLAVAWFQCLIGKVYSWEYNCTRKSKCSNNSFTWLSCSHLLHRLYHHKI